MVLKYLTLLTFFLLVSGCYLGREYPVEYDYNFIANFEQYETFCFVNTPHQFDSRTDQLIKKTIINHMELLGYTFTPDRINANLLVNYFYYNGKLKYHGYSQPDMKKFIKNSEEEKRNEKYHKRKLPINRGTFVINFTDNREHLMVWQGYTTDLYRDRIFQDPRKTRIAIISILKNYGYIPLELQNN
ncbi:DUF4136 domain-containing protein [Marivirga sp. S37H4]|uniref:DUF4136 domain-containing protein n=1 Tax=Marivirga aurantiaca TaxID=2802615 RepID=A0A934WWL5_9BACT|nr:DUF4136 domain-containing protein [Marivirga aurantiaca]MBK6264287.1 DUF4136 domain-containing protein [Marivirga aurantiaca]